MEGIVDTDLVPALEELEITSNATTMGIELGESTISNDSDKGDAMMMRLGLAELMAFNDSDKGDGSEGSCPWSLTHEQQVYNLKENWKRALYWTGGLVKIENEFETNPWFIEVVAKLRVDPCLDSSELKIEQSLLGQFLWGARMNSLDLAILMGDLKMVQKILKSSFVPHNVIYGPIQDLSSNRRFLQLTPIFDICTKTGILYTPLHLAVEGGDSHIVDALLENGANVNAPNWEGQTPLDLAWKLEDVAMFEQLLPKNREEKKDPFHVAVQDGDINLIKRLPSLNVNAMNYKKETPLHLAIEGGDSHIVDVLLEKGADVNAVNYKKETPLHWVAEGGDSHLLNLLLEKGADVNAMNYKKETPLHLFIKGGDSHIVDVLLEKGTNVNVVNYKKETPLHLAVEYKNSHIVDVVLKKGADINAMNYKKDTPLHLAVKGGNRYIVDVLLEKGANVNVVNYKDETPLHWAIEGGNSHIINALLDKGANVNAPNWEGQTPLDLAYKHKSDTILQLLAKDSEEKHLFHIVVRHGDIDSIKEMPSLNVNVLNRKKETLLHWAVEGGNIQVVDALLEKGSNVNARNCEGQTPLDLACKKKNFNMLDQLLVKDKEGKDPLHVAMQNGDIDFIKKLPSPKVNAVDYKKRTLLHYLATKRFEDSHITNIVKHLAKESELDVKALDESNFSAFYVAVLFCNTPYVIALLDSFKDQMRLNEVCNEKCGPPIQIAFEGGSKFNDIHKALMECTPVIGFMDKLYRDRQVYVDAANAILVGAALIASVTFASWLQPPLNYTSYFGEGYLGSSSSDLNYVDVEHNIALRAFWIFNALSFYFSIATVVCGARSVLPKSHSFIEKTVEKLRTNLLVTSILLAFSVLFVIIAFGIAGTIVLTPQVKYQWCMIVPTIVGGVVCIISLIYLVKSMVENYRNRCDRSVGFNIDTYKIGD